MNNITTSAQRAMPAVVRIHCRGFSENQWTSLLDPRQVPTEEWTGTGFFIHWKNEEGWLLTNGHVARSAHHLEIRSIFTSDEPFKVECIGLVPNLEPDVALLRLLPKEITRFKKMGKISKIPSLHFGNSKIIRRGEAIKAIGYPLGMEEPNISAGEISNFIGGTPGTVERFVTDAAINLGNSGGPAISRSGKVLGINTAIVLGANNISFITPIHLAENILGLLAQGKTPGLSSYGAHLQRNSKMNAQQLKMKTCEGIIVAKTIVGGFAEEAGLEQRDVITAINGTPIDRHGIVKDLKNRSRKQNLFDLLHMNAPQAPVRLQIWRRGKILQRSAGIKPGPSLTFPSQPLWSRRAYICLGGMIIQEVSDELVEGLRQTYNIDSCFLMREYLESKSQLLVTHVCPESSAEELFIEVGDFIVKLNSKRITTLKTLEASLKSALKKRSSLLLETSSGLMASLDNQKGDLKLSSCLIRKPKEPSNR